MVSLMPDSMEPIEPQVAPEAERETRMTPKQAVGEMRIRVPVRANRTLRTVIDRVNRDDQLKGWWHVSNVNAVARMEINDHSWVHIQIVTNIALKLLRQLTKHGVEPNVVRDYGYSRDDAEVIVALTALTHCVGMSVHRQGHEDFSLFLSEPKLRELLDGIYEEPDLTVIVSEVLQGIISHRSDGQPLTLEAGILRVSSRRPAQGEAARLGARAVCRGTRTHRHRSRKASRSALRARPLIQRSEATMAALAGSSNGRTPDSGSGSLGSSPSPAARWKSPAFAGLLFSDRTIFA
jgi:metal-dependent HD superfamily phosphatase/phosphodiesterase